MRSLNTRHPRESPLTLEAQNGWKRSEAVNAIVSGLHDMKLDT